jgi:predicted heme/steroid binding protein
MHTPTKQIGASHSNSGPDIEHAGSNPNHALPVQRAAFGHHKDYDRMKEKIKRSPKGRRLKRDGTVNPLYQYAPRGSRYDVKEGKLFDAQGQEIFDCSTCKQWKAIDNFPTDHRGKHLLTCKDCRQKWISYHLALPALQTYSDTLPCDTTSTVTSTTSRRKRKVLTMIKSPHSRKADIKRNLDGRRLKEDGTRHPKRLDAPRGFRYDEKEGKYFNVQSQEIFDCSSCRMWKTIDNFSIDGRGQHILRCKNCQARNKASKLRRKPKAMSISSENKDTNDEREVEDDVLEGGSSKELNFGGNDEEERGLMGDNND